MQSNESRVFRQQDMIQTSEKDDNMHFFSPFFDWLFLRSKHDRHKLLSWIAIQQLFSSSSLQSNVFSLSFSHSVQGGDLFAHWIVNGEAEETTEGDGKERKRERSLLPGSAKKQITAQDKRLQEKELRTKDHHHRHRREMRMTEDGIRERVKEGVQIKDNRSEENLCFRNKMDSRDADASVSG